MSFMLDTNAVSHALRGQGRVAERLTRARPSEVVVSSIGVAELAFGIGNRASEKLERAVQELLQHVEILPFDEEAAWRYGIVASDLRQRGQPIGVLDAMIAAHALQTDRTLVTNNTSHFERVEGLKWEDWY